jgi:SAM-dependent methyltransferase
MRAAGMRAGEVVVDYGAGDGYLLTELARRFKPAEMWAFEPQSVNEVRALVGSSANIVETPGELPSSHFDKVFCLEVLEHLPPETMDAALTHMRRIVKPQGRVIVSVPIEMGVPGLFKNLVRIGTRHPHDGTTFPAVMNSLFGRSSKIERVRWGDYFPSHIGWDHRRLPQVLREHGFRVESTTASPVAALGSWLNSQITYTLAKAS